MEITLTAVFKKFPEGYAAFVEELPGANTQGATLEEARANLKEAVEMVLQANRELAEESLRDADVVREPLSAAKSKDSRRTIRGGLQPRLNLLSVSHDSAGTTG